MRLRSERRRPENYVLGSACREAKEILAFVNSESARAVADRRHRRRALAMLPMQDTPAAIETREDAIGRFHLSGVSMISHVDQGPLVAEERIPIFERIAKPGVALDWHLGLTVAHPHLGGVLPYLRTRFEMVHNLHLPGQRKLDEYLHEHFLGDTVNHTPGAVEMAIAMYGQIASATPLTTRGIAR
jgi:hypothetical protein